MGLVGRLRGLFNGPASYRLPVSGPGYGVGPYPTGSVHHRPLVVEAFDAVERARVGASIFFGAGPWGVVFWVVGWV